MKKLRATAVLFSSLNGTYNLCAGRLQLQLGSKFELIAVDLGFPTPVTVRLVAQRLANRPDAKLSDDAR